jgi:hypothetical protein
MRIILTFYFSTGYFYADQVKGDENFTLCSKHGINDICTYTRVLSENLRGEDRVVDIGAVDVQPRLLAKFPKNWTQFQAGRTNFPLPHSVEASYRAYPAS